MGYRTNYNVEDDPRVILISFSPKVYQHMEPPFLGFYILWITTMPGGNKVSNTRYMAMVKNVANNKKNLYHQSLVTRLTTEVNTNS
jgi:hypothetical protein